MAKSVSCFNCNSVLGFEDNGNIVVNNTLIKDIANFGCPACGKLLAWEKGKSTKAAATPTFIPEDKKGGKPE